jgi:hypothetical protein
MQTSLEVKLRNAALGNATLVSLLGSSPFRWFGPQAPPGLAFPSVEVQQVSQVPQYSTTALLISAQYRMQFTIWDEDLERARSVKNAIIQFLTTFNAYSTSSAQPLQPNRVLNARLGKSQAATDPITWWITVDALIWNNETT